MTIDTSYQDQFPFLFAGNAGTIKISASANEEIPVKAEHIRRSKKKSTHGFVLVAKTDYEAEFSLSADSFGKLELDLSRICLAIQSVLPSASAPLFLPSSYGGPLKPRDSIRMTFGTDGNSVFEKTVFFGRVGDGMLSEIYGHKCFITSRPQIGYSRMDGENDNLAVVAGNTRILATLYLGLLPPAEIIVGEFDEDLTAADVSYSTIRDLADTAGYSGHEIKAYDIWAETSLTDDDGNVTSVVKSEVLRFIVPDRKVSTFEFLSSVGVLEPIYAMGSKKSEVETETRTFVNDGVERELTNDSRIVHETFTGWLAGADEVRFWQEFFSSAERYAVIDGVSRGIIIDEIDSESTAGELNAFSFKWHYADKYADPSRTPERKELKQYKPTI